MGVLSRLGPLAFRALAPILWIEDRILTVILGPKIKPEDAYPDP